MVSTPSGLVTVDAETGNISWQLNDSNASIVCPVGVAGQGGVTGTRLICCPQSAKGLLHFWRFKSENGAIDSSGNPVYKCSTPEKFTALAFSSCGGLMVAGSPTGIVYVWQTWTGALLRSWTAHFGAVTNIKLSADDMYLFTGSEDASVKKYFVPHLFSKSDPVPIPSAVLSGHTGKINDIIVPTFLRHVVTASADKSIKIFDLDNASQIAHFSIDSAEPLRICTDNTLTTVFAGCSDGSVVAVPLNYQSVEAFRAVHQGPVTGVAMTLDCSRIVTCASDGVKIWDVSSRVQLMHVMGPNQQLKNSLGLLLIRKPLLSVEPESPDSGTKLVLGIDAYLQFKPLQRTLTQVESIDVIPLIRARAESSASLSKVKKGFCINRVTVEGNFASKEDIIAKLTSDLNKAKETSKKWASVARELYLQVSALKPDGQAELVLPVVASGSGETNPKKKRKQ